jgi:uncharacterized protein (TIGR01777 family)
MLLPYYFFIGGPIGSGKQGFAWIHLQDEISAIEFFIHNPQTRGVFNLTAPQIMNNREFSQAIGKVMKRPAWFPVPGFALKLVLGEMSTVLLDGQFVRPKRLMEHGFTFTYPDAESALSNLLKK